MDSPSDENALCNAVEAALVEGDLHKAVDLCKSLLMSFPQSARCYSLTSSLFKATGNYRKAFDYSSIATGLDTCVATYHLQQGELLYILKDYTQALAAFERASCISRDSNSSRWIGKCLVALERFEEAIGGRVVEVLRRVVVRITAIKGAPPLDVRAAARRRGHSQV